MRSNLFDIINTHGKLISGKEIDYRKNVMSKFRWTNEWVGKDEKNKEYLFLMEK